MIGGGLERPFRVLGVQQLAIGGPSKQALRYLWMRQKRLQGSHFANDEQSKGINDLVIAEKVDPCLGKVFEFAGTGECHQLMRENKHPSGNMAILVNAPRPGLRTLEDVRSAK